MNMTESHRKSKRGYMNPHAEAQTCYQPYHKFVEYLQETAELFNKKKELTENGIDLSIENKRRIRKNDRMKVHYLNTHVFRSMANLITFFEYVGMHPEIREYFEDDMRELLLGVGPDQGKGTAFARLFNTAMEWNVEKDPDNFRLMLLDQIQWLIVAKIMGLTGRIFDDGMTNQLVAPDMLRAWHLVRLYSKGASRPDKFEDRDQSRRVLF